MRKATKKENEEFKKLLRKHMKSKTSDVWFNGKPISKKQRKEMGLEEGL